MKWLLDTNVLFSALWSTHGEYPATCAWLARAKPDGWGVTVETYLGVIRLLMNPTTTDGTPLKASDAVEAVRTALAGPHPGKIVKNAEPDDSFLKKARGHRQIMDFYLVQMASETGAKLVTRDNGLLAEFPSLTTRPV